VSGGDGVPRPTLSLLDRVLPTEVRGRALVVGDLMLDRYLMGEVGRISPEAPVPVVRARGQRLRPGGASNVALGIRALGGECALVGLVGEDRAGAALRERMSRKGVANGGVLTDASRPTTVKVRVLARHQQMLRIDHEETRPAGGATEERLREAALAELAEADVLVLDDYDKGTVTPGLASALIEAASERGIPSIVDPKLRNFFAYGGVDVFKPNGSEVASALGREQMPEDVETLRKLAGRVGSRHLLVTVGERGMVLLEEGADALIRIESRARDVFDVSGAGDTVTAVLAAGLMGGGPLLEAAVLANHAAGLEVARLGARPVARGEIARSLREA